MTAGELPVGPFAFYRGPRLVFGIGSLGRLGAETASMGKNLLLVASRGWMKGSGRAEALLDSLARESLQCSVLEVSGEPGPELVDEAVARFSSGDIEVVAAVGGGSAMDTGKAISAMLECGRGSVVDFLEGVGTAKPTGAKKPLIAIPTTSGSGSEATKNAVLSRLGEGGFKRSLRHDNYVPDLAIVDPELTVTCPARVTAACGMDALSQLVESYMSSKASAMTDSLAFDAIGRVGRSIRAAHGGACDTGAVGKEEHLQACAEMAYAAFVSGVTLANAGLGVVHGLAGPVGALLPIPHGLVCGSLLAPALKVTVNKLNRVGGDGLLALRKLARLGWLLSRTGCFSLGNTGSSDQDLLGWSLDDTVRVYVSALVDRVYDLARQLEIPSPSDLGLSSADCDRIVVDADNKNNPVPLDAGEMRAVLMDGGSY